MIKYLQVHSSNDYVSTCVVCVLVGDFMFLPKLLAIHHSYTLLAIRFYVSSLNNLSSMKAISDHLYSYMDFKENKLHDILLVISGLSMHGC